jgi:hypothetical protein
MEALQAEGVTDLIFGIAGETYYSSDRWFL